MTIFERIHRKQYSATISTIVAKDWLFVLREFAIRSSVASTFPRIQKIVQRGAEASSSHCLSEVSATMRFRRDREPTSLYAAPPPSDGTKSCLTLPRFLQPKQQRSTDNDEWQDFATTPFVQQPKKYSTSTPRTAYEDDDDNPLDVSDTTPPAHNLLRMPQPKDRSDPRQHTRRGLYDGEMEPEGVRGQEAKVEPASSRRVKQRDMPDVKVNKPRWNTPILKAPSMDEPPSVASSATSRSHKGVQFAPSHQAALGPIRSESTDSDDNIESMLPDLAPHDEPPTLSPVARTAADTASVADWNRKALQASEACDYDQALVFFAKVLHQHTQTYGPIHPLVAAAHHNIGTVHAKRAASLRQDSLEQQEARQHALEAFQAAARGARDSLGPHHPNVAVSLVRIGFVLLQSRQYAHAVVTLVEALRIRRAHYGEQHGLVANLYNNLGVCHMHLGEFEKGQKYLESALAIQRTMEGGWVQQLELADTLFNLGGLCLEWIRKQGPDARRAAMAEESFAEALKVCLGSCLCGGALLDSVSHAGTDSHPDSGRNRSDGVAGESVVGHGSFHSTAQAARGGQSQQSSGAYR